MLRWVLLIAIAGVFGSVLYAHGVPSWAVYIVRHLVYLFGGRYR